MPNSVQEEMTRKEKALLDYNANRFMCRLGDMWVPLGLTWTDFVAPAIVCFSTSLKLAETSSGPHVSRLL